MSDITDSDLLAAAGYSNVRKLLVDLYKAQRFTSEQAEQLVGTVESVAVNIKRNKQRLSQLSEIDIKAEFETTLKLFKQEQHRTF